MVASYPSKIKARVRFSLSAYMFKLIKKIFTRRYLRKLYFVPFLDENGHNLKIVTTEIFAPRLKLGDTVKIYGRDFVCVDFDYDEILLKHKEVSGNNKSKTYEESDGTLYEV